MGWYKKLNQYFPDEEMKAKGLLEALIEKNSHYQKLETDQYILLYGEYDEFIFVDYVLVSKEARGQGIGSQILDKLKDKEKVIVLEVEPIDENDPDTQKREHFYLMNGFLKADQINYYLDVGEVDPELQPMEIYYWNPQGKIEAEQIRSYLITAYKDIHLYQYDKHHSREAPDPKKLVTIETNELSSDLNPEVTSNN